ncbi:hypothetical protein [Rickettsia endosymbiont of Cantharis rufa]|uniref:hypothetical protein n=1 Tax=Rickettsia endosymbiont of Cantharis rufa TaxID=3066248 RepID=UPI003132A549
MYLLKYASQEQESPKEIKNEIVLSAYASLERYKWTDREHNDAAIVFQKVNNRRY